MPCDQLPHLSSDCAYGRDGYVLVRGLFDAVALGVLRDYRDAMRHRPASMVPPLVYRQMTSDGAEVPARVEAFWEDFPEFASLLARAGVPEVTRRLLGDEPVLYKEKLIFKEPGSEGFQPHQDVNYGWFRFARCYCNLAIALDDCTPASGPLEISPGSHRLGNLGKPWHLIEPGRAAELPFIPVEMAAGDALFFDGLLAHRSAPNRSDRPRAIVYLTWNGAREGDFRRDYYALVPRMRRRFVLQAVFNNIRRNSDAQGDSQGASPRQNADSPAASDGESTPSHPPSLPVA